VSSKEETFTALAAAFRFNDAATDLFLKGPMESLEEFQYYFTGEREIDEFLEAAGDSPIILYIPIVDTPLHRAGHIQFRDFVDQRMACSTSAIVSNQRRRPMHCGNNQYPISPE
jgi:hypothetical protein